MITKRGDCPPYWLGKLKMISYMQGCQRELWVSPAFGRQFMWKTLDIQSKCFTLPWISKHAPGDNLFVGDVY